MISNYKIEKINYDLINSAVNIRPLDRTKLFGYPDRYVAVKPVSNGYFVLMETIGKRDECSRSLEKFLRENTANSN